MSRKPTLSVVNPDDPAPRKPLTLTEAAKSGSHRDLLIAMRDRIAESIQSPDCPPRDLAALTRRLQDIAKDLQALDAAVAQEGERDARDVEDEAFDASAI